MGKEKGEENQELVAAPASDANSFHQGTRRRASTVTRIMGHLNSSKKPKGSWIIGLVFFEKNPGLENVRDIVNERLLKKIGRFRSRMVVGRFKSYFREVDGVDMDYHCPQEFEPGSEEPWTKEKLLHYCGELNSFPYDLNKPLWRYVLIPELDDGRACLICCVNHALGDGLSQVEVLFSLLEDEDDTNSKVDENATPEEKEKAKLDKQNSARHTGRRKKGPALSTKQKIGGFLAGVIDGLMAPFAAQDPPNSLKLKDHKNPSPDKLLAVTEPISLERMKEVKNKFDGATLNDIMMALLTLTLRSYYIEAGDKCVPQKGKNKGSKVSGQFPISIRPKGAPSAFKKGEPQNNFAYGYFDFDLSTDDPIATVWSVKRQVDFIKISPSPFIQQRLASMLMKILPREIYLGLILNASNLGTAQISNVPGPQIPVSLAGTKVDEMSFFLFSPLGMYFGILTYAGTCQASINVDSSLGDPKAVAKHWNLEFEKMYETVMAHEGQIDPPQKKCC